MNLDDRPACLEDPRPGVRPALDRIAAALGACPACLGECADCPECGGAGGPGTMPPDPTLYALLVAPAGRRLTEAPDRPAPGDLIARLLAGTAAR
ncbi:MAG: hypothetical protein ACU0BS_10160 [Hasllibacter sp.]